MKLIANRNTALIPLLSLLSFQMKHTVSIMLSQASLKDSDELRTAVLNAGISESVQFIAQAHFFSVFLLIDIIATVRPIGTGGGSTND